MTEQQNNPMLIQLVKSGLLEIGQVLLCPIPTVHAVITAKGIHIDGMTFEDPTEAMRFVTGAESSLDNGWIFWKVADPVRGFVKPLEHLQIEFLASDSKAGVRTSTSHPLRIDELTIPGFTGKIGMTLMPGKKGDALYGAPWDRSLDQDISVIKKWTADIVLTLMEEHEFELLGVPNFKSVMSCQDFKWIQLAIRDSDVPNSNFEAKWIGVKDKVVCCLKAGGKVLIHCRGGLGRTGMIAANLLGDFGFSAEQAILAVRNARPSTIETWEQQKYVFRSHRESEKWRSATKYVMSTGVWIEEASFRKLIPFDDSSRDGIISEWLESHQIFSITFECRRYFPLFAFRQGDFSKPFIKPVIDVFNKKSDWGKAFWFASLCSYLGARVPQEVIEHDLNSVLLAAKDEAAGVLHG